MAVEVELRSTSVFITICLYRISKLKFFYPLNAVDGSYITARISIYSIKSKTYTLKIVKWFCSASSAWTDPRRSLRFMASLSTLPTELQLEIIEMIYANIPTPNLFGKNAAWILPEHDENDFQYYKPTRLLTIDDSKAEFDSSEESDKSDEMKVAKELEESNKPDEIMAAPNGAMISNPLLALRL